LPFNEIMNAFLIITEEEAFSMEGACLREIFSKWDFHMLSEKPYKVVIITDDDFGEVKQFLCQYPYEYKLVELGKAEAIKGLGKN
jgi:hypothetical protein